MFTRACWCWKLWIPIWWSLWEGHELATCYLTCVRIGWMEGQGSSSCKTPRMLMTVKRCLSCKRLENFLMPRTIHRLLHLCWAPLWPPCLLPRPHYLMNYFTRGSTRSRWTAVKCFVIQFARYMSQSVLHLFHRWMWKLFSGFWRAFLHARVCWTVHRGRNFRWCHTFLFGTVGWTAQFGSRRES